MSESEGISIRSVSLYFLRRNFFLGVAKNYDISYCCGNICFHWRLGSHYVKIVQRGDAAGLLSQTSLLVFFPSELKPSLSLL